MWSCAVLLAELFKKVERGDKACENLIDTLVFSGTQCFPLSPNKNKTLEPDGFSTTDGHILESIFDMIGTPSEVDLSFVTDESALAFIKEFKPRKAVDLKTKFPHISDKGLNLLKMML